MHIQVLGSAAGGGFPQWNCRCTHCEGARRGDAAYRARSQSSLLVRPSHGRAVLINASPDVRQQMLGLTAPRTESGGPREHDVGAVILLDAQIDHATGLLFLRESSERLQIFCTARVHAELTQRLPLLNVLGHYCGVDWHEIVLGQAFEVDCAPGVRFEPVSMQGKPPPYSPERQHPAPGDTIGLLVGPTAGGRQALYAPGLAAIDAAVLQAMEQAELLLVDGTCWHDDDLARARVGTKTARSMGHLPLSGPGGLLETLARWPDKERVLVHINNTNPILDERSAERAALSATGVLAGEDGMVFELGA